MAIYDLRARQRLAFHGLFFWISLIPYFSVIVLGNQFLLLYYKASMLTQAHSLSYAPQGLSRCACFHHAQGFFSAFFVMTHAAGRRRDAAAAGAFSEHDAGQLLTLLYTRASELKHATLIARWCVHATRLGVAAP